MKTFLLVLSFLLPSVVWSAPVFDVASGVCHSLIQQHYANASIDASVTVRDKNGAVKTLIHGFIRRKDLRRYEYTARCEFSNGKVHVKLHSRRAPKAKA